MLHYIMDCIEGRPFSARGWFWLAYCAVWGWIAAQFV